MSIEIINMYNKRIILPWDVRIDRRSCLGNPFRLGDESQRDYVCDKYTSYFYYQIELGNQKIITKLKELQRLYKKYGKLSLFCWCAPKRCHGETIKKYLLERS